MTQRRLAHVEVIEKLTPIAGADFIEVAHVLGWQCVVKKGEFHVGQKIVYIEVDSIVPPIPAFEFLKERKYRVKTIKLRKQISQGLVVSTDILQMYNPEIGMDVTDRLKIVKYDPQGDIEKSQFGAMARFPSWISKTDEERIQNLSKDLRACIHEVFNVTEKLDGTSATYFLTRKRKWFFFWDYDFGVCSRNLRLTEVTNISYWRIVQEQEIREALVHIMHDLETDNVVLQGEIVGEGIQGNKYGLKGIDFYAFNLIVNGIKFSHFQMTTMLKPFGIKTVPLLTPITLKPNENLDVDVESVVRESMGTSRLNPKIQREGIVVRLGDVSFKAINPQFLLDNGE